MRFTLAAAAPVPALVTALVAALVAVLVAAGPAVADAPALAHPESVVMAGEQGFVSNLGQALDTSTRDGDGFIARIGPHGEVLDGPAIPQPGSTLDSPKGLALLGGRLYVADIDRIVAFDPATGRQLAEYRPEGARSLNDLAPAGERLLVTDFEAGRVLSLDPGTGRFDVIASGIGGANGVVADGDRAYVVATGAQLEGGGITRIDLTSGATAPVGDIHGRFDGVALAADGALIVSDWVAMGTPTPGRILRVDPATGAAEPVAAPAMRGPADLARSGDRLLVPVMLEHRVAVLPAP